MLAYRHFLALSTSSVVIFGSGSLAIAQAAPVVEPATDGDSSVVAASILEPELTSSSEPAIQDAPNDIALSFAQPTEKSFPINLAEDPIAALNPHTVSLAPLRQTKDEVAFAAPTTNNTDSVLIPDTLVFPSQGSVTSAKLSVKPLPQPSVDTNTLLSKQGSLHDASLTPRDTPAIATTETPAVEIPVDVQIAQAEEMESMPSPAVVPVEDFSDAPLTEASNPRNIPFVNEVPEEFETNEELQLLLDDVDKEALIRPTSTDEVLADDVLNLTLQETIDLAIERNQDLQEAQLRYERATYQLKEARAAEYPTLTNQTDLTNSETAGNELAAEAAGVDESFPSNTLSSTFSLNYDVFTGGRRSGQIDLASTQLEIAELDVARITKDTRLAASSVYYDLQSGDAQVFIEESSVEEANQSLRDAMLLEQAGRGTKFDVLRAQVKLANAEQRLTRALANQNTVRRRLAQLLSLEPKTEPFATDAITQAGSWELSLEESIILALQQREELRQQLLQREIDGYQEQIALSALRPQFSLFANYNITNVYYDDLDEADGFTLGARMQWNIFDGGAAHSRAGQEKVDQAIAENRFVNQSDQIRLAVEQAYFNLRASEENITTSQLARELAEESLRLARLRFRAGVGTQTDVISAQTERTTALNNFEQAITDYNRAYAQLKREVSVGEEIEIVPGN